MGRRQPGPSRAQRTAYAGVALTGASGEKKANLAAWRTHWRPDAEIGIFSENYVGNDGYNKNGDRPDEDDVRSQGGDVAVLPCLIETHGRLRASFRFKGFGAGTGYTVTCVNCAICANITAAGRNGRSSTENLARESRPPLRSK